MKHWNQDNIGYKEFIERLSKTGLEYKPYAEGIDVNNDNWQEDFAKILEVSEEVESEVGGTSLKFFTRIDDSKSGTDSQHRSILDSKHFSELISEIQSNPKCSYKTIYNDLIKSGYTPRYFSALIKDCHGIDDRVLSEVAFSRLANLLNIPTNFSIAIENPNKAVNKKYLGVVSIDYLGYDSEIQMLKEIVSDDSYLSYHSANLHEWIKYIDRCISKLSPNGVNQQQRDLIIKNFIKSYIFRSGIFPDNDLSSYNVGLIVGKDGIEMLPNTDAEGCVQGVCMAHGYDHLKENRIERIIEYCHDFYPDTLKEFTSDLHEAMESKELKKTLCELFRIDEETPKSRLVSNKQIVEDILKISQFTLDYYEQIKDVSHRTYFQI